jgi:hypothetical protein
VGRGPAASAARARPPAGRARPPNVMRAAQGSRPLRRCCDVGSRLGVAVGARWSGAGRTRGERLRDSPSALRPAKDLHRHDRPHEYASQDPESRRSRRGRPHKIRPTPHLGRARSAWDLTRRPRAGVLGERSRDVPVRSPRRRASAPSKRPSPPGWSRARVLEDSALELLSPPNRGLIERGFGDRGRIGLTASLALCRAPAPSGQAGRDHPAPRGRACLPRARSDCR